MEENRVSPAVSPVNPSNLHINPAIFEDLGRIRWILRYLLWKRLCEAQDVMCALCALHLSAVSFTQLYIILHNGIEDTKIQKQISGLETFQTRACRLLRCFVSMWSIATPVGPMLRPQLSSDPNCPKPNEQWKWLLIVFHDWKEPQIWAKSLWSQIAVPTWATVWISCVQRILSVSVRYKAYQASFVYATSILRWWVNEI